MQKKLITAIRCYKQWGSKFLLSSLCAVMLSYPVFSFAGSNSEVSDKNNPAIENTINEFVWEKYVPNREIIGQYDKDSAVKCENGTFVGKRTGNILAFKGIPYAEQPIGSLRWKLPKATKASDKIYEAYHFGKAPIQPKSIFPDASITIGEDCLYLNVYLNAKDQTKNKPVMVYIYGGSFLTGSGAEPYIAGYNFVRQNTDIILVTINYRLGILGFADFSKIPGGEAYPDINLGIYDQLEALRWVKKNIAAFGGDPERVTLFGESAGAGSVSTLAIVPEARGLFKRIIAQSSSVSLCTTKDTTALPAENLAKAFQAKNMKDLFRISEDNLADYWVKNGESAYNYIVMDGRLLKKDPFELWEEGATKDLDVLQGVLTDEWRISKLSFQSEAEYETANHQIMDKLYENGNAEYKKLHTEFLKYLKGISDPKWLSTEFLTDYSFYYGAFRQANAHAKNGGRGYFYIMNQSSDIPELRACHITDVFYVFGNFDGTIVKESREAKALSKKIQKMWAQFARTGNPSIENYDWPQYDNKNYSTMILGPEIKAVNDPRKIRREFIEKMGAANPAFRHDR